jgi:hypothetical protein
MTFTACHIDDSDDENGDENGNGGVTGKRLKTSVSTGPGFYSRTEISYNSDGTMKGSDVYDESSKRICYANHTSNPDGTLAKEEFYDIVNNTSSVYNFSYDTNKKLQKAEGIYYADKVQWATGTVVYTFQNGRKTRQVTTLTSIDGSVTVQQLDFNYDAQGRRTTTDEINTPNRGDVIGLRTFTRTYKTDGTLEKVTYPSDYTATSGTNTDTFTWENGKTTMNFDDINPY